MTILTEINAEKQSLSQTISFLKKNGTLAKAGAYGLALIHPTEPYVYKIWTEDKGFLVFAQHCINHENKHFPKIYKLKKLKLSIPESDREYVWVAKIKKYHEVTTNDTGHLAFLSNSGNKLNVGAYNFDKKLLKLAPANKETESFKEAVVELSELSLKHQVSFDFGSRHNLMKDDDGTIVIIDPFENIRNKNPPVSLSQLAGSAIDY